MRIGGFVIHGNNADTLERCLESLVAVCDEVLAVDSCSTDGSADLVRARGLRSLVVPWKGYGHARAAAAAELRHCDYVFFLDSDEWLAPGAADAFARFRADGPFVPHLSLRRNDWAELSGRRFRFRTETQIRLVRRDAATWDSSMIVHESLPRRETVPLPAVIEHRWATSVEDLVRKQDKYALLWAVRAFCEGRRPRPTMLRRSAHVLRNCVVKGAFLRGGWTSVRLAWAISRYHVLKHDYLREVLAGGHAAAVADFRCGRWERLYA